MPTIDDRVGVCSWSLRPRSARDLAAKVRSVGVGLVQLALDPIWRGEWDVDETARALQSAGVRIASGMMGMAGEDYTTLASIRRTGGVRPAATWRRNLAAAQANARIARRLGIRLVTFHAGFLPESRRDRSRRAMIARLVRLARVFAGHGVRVALETGQESAATLLGVLAEVNRGLSPRQRVGVNFDPGNMIMYDQGDPVEALRGLLPHVLQVHVKDATRTRRPGTWGPEAPAGEGEVDWAEFLGVLRGTDIPLMIEREAGGARVRDARKARALVARILRTPAGARRDRPVGVGVIALGFMGRTHVAAYQELSRRAGAPRVRLVAVCDERAERRRPGATRAGNLGTGAGGSLWDPRATRALDDPAALLADPAIEAVSICTPTDTHTRMAIAALRAGKHVLVEKPVAISPADIRAIAREAERSGKVCMPAMCMRFWPGWDWLKGAVDSRRYGRLTSLLLQRLGTIPGWSRDFYTDPARSGSALVDLHVHDADLVHWLLGMPDSVSSAGTRSHVSTHYRYHGRPGLLVCAQGSWDHAPGWKFQMRYVATFERATAEFELGREPRLLLARGGKRTPVPIAPGAGYAPEIEHFVHVVARVRRDPAARPGVTLADAEAAARLLEAEARSLRTGRVERIRRA